ncbi:uncharacterized protein PITG_14165 [Phytophthora infestans T30-4]|uniref:Uncharacterized protein n=1 Tax=Phytophthora infestans (strain T30-4) TaxID=403677 RepID=D0NNS2_PHYIT|nr:uncharacterized protein PITG_14165 [Phytophthora infestans T30-4]EEY62243.1 conserved hypothetical protein [Phytophthora infestans T30-4]|eukprot:XP_002899274.1 conserved hypothetical protein [Phytophthora infestans T30-4]
MDLPTTSRRYQAAIAAARFADQRLESRTRSDYSSSLRRFSAFCKSDGYPDPLKKRFVELPGVVAAYINLLETSNSTQWPAEKLRAALSWHYTKREMLAGGHPHDRWVVETSPDGTPAPRGNPTRSAAITRILAGLSKSKKRERTPKRASPMSLLMLTKAITFLESNSMFNETMRLWFSAVCSLSFYGILVSSANRALMTATSSLAVSLFVTGRQIMIPSQVEPTHSIISRRKNGQLKH